MTDIERHEQWLIDLENRVRYLETLNTPSDYSLSYPEEPENKDEVKDAVTKLREEFGSLIEQPEKYSNKKKSYKY